MIETKICYIGGGSADWAPKLMRDLALQDELTGELRLYDAGMHSSDQCFKRRSGVRNGAPSTDVKVEMD